MKNTENKGVKTIEETISVSGRKIGTVKIDKEKIIRISEENLNTALHGDFVEVRMLNSKGELEGAVEKILSRGKIGHAGIFAKTAKGFFVVPSDPRMYASIKIKDGKTAGAKEGEKVFAEITDWTDPKKEPEGVVVRVLGKPFDNETEMQSIALERGFEGDFPEAIENAAKKLYESYVSSAEIPRRRDMRKETTFTIDPYDAKDFDDAISVKKTGENYEIGIHIADVSHFVHPDTPLDAEAIKRSTSVYLVDRTIPMLPEVLSNDLCSLKEGVDRLTMSAIFIMTKDGRVINEWFGKTIIHSNKRFTYEEAQEVLDGKIKSLFETELALLNSIAKKLTKKRFDEGAISLEQDEVKFVLDARGVPVRIIRKSRIDTNKLVEEFMLLANRHVAACLAKKMKTKGTSLYRIHDSPDRERIADLHYFLNQLGFSLPMKDGLIPQKALNDLVQTLTDHPSRDTVQTAIVRAMAKAIYSTKNIGHYGLGFKEYTHFTSPIRRYPDVVVHRLVMKALAGASVPKEEWREYELIARTSSERERQATDAERASIKYKQVEYMSTRVGQEFDGVISGVTEWGIYVEDKETKCEGMIPLRNLKGDFYVFNPKKLALEGRKKGKKFRLGDALRVRVVKADLERKIIDYELA